MASFKAPTNEELTCDRLTADIWLWQRKRGHRFSSDDVVTAYVASLVVAEQGLAPARILDLGCGIGSVLLHLAWCYPAASLTGIEAQQVSFELLQRNISHNRLGDRVRSIAGDIRNPDTIRQLAGEPKGSRPPQFDLITGTPPYFPPTTAVDALDEQRAYARIEYRGGVEAYIAAGAPLLAPEAPLVLCGDADAEFRTQQAAEANQLRVDHRCVVFPRAHAKPLFTVWVLHRSDRMQPSLQLPDTLTLRDTDGKQTEDAWKLRNFSQIP